jgi:hypothetical protein
MIIYDCICIYYSAYPAVFSVEMVSCGKKHLGRSRLRGENNIFRMVLKEMWWEGVDGCIWLL